MRILVSSSILTLFFLLFSCQNQPASGTDTAAPQDNTSGNAAGGASADPAANTAASTAPVSVDNLPLVREDRIIKQMEVSSFSQVLAAKPNIIILDFRSPSDFKVGHIARATNMPADDPDFMNKLNALGLSNDYAVYCNNGSISMNAAQQMKGLGFMRVFHLHGGLASWSAAKLPLQQ